MWIILKEVMSFLFNQLLALCHDSTYITLREVSIIRISMPCSTVHGFLVSTCLYWNFHSGHKVGLTLLKIKSIGVWKNHFSSRSWVAKSLPGTETEAEYQELRNCTESGHRPRWNTDIEVGEEIIIYLQSQLVMFHKCGQE